MYKQAIVVRTDIGMSCGKMAAQASHASLGAYKKAGTMRRKLWEIEGEKKVVLECHSLEELLSLEKMAKKSKIPCYVVRDAGMTELKPGTITAIAIGPDKEDRIDRITGNLKAVKGWK